MKLKRFVLGVLAMSAGLTASAKGQSFSLLYSFAGGTADGSGPTGSLTDVGGVLYGMTPGGGANGRGTIFSYNLASGAETMMHSFSGFPNDGALPHGSFIQSSTDSSI